MENKPDINVCVCTYLRVQCLRQCLESLIDQKFSKAINYSITVIDNDKDQSAKSVVGHFQTQNKVPVYYFCEVNRGIPFARNRALDESVKLGANCIAFIDDDEQACPDWLSSLYTCLCSYSEPVIIHGRVIPKFPDGTSKHMRELFYTKKDRPTGTRLQTCATDNVILPTSIISKFNLSFDVSTPLAGGTDTKFFFETNKRGVAIYQCSQAIAYETIFQSRLKVGWLIHRKFRAGITMTWLRLQTGKSKFGLFLKSFEGIFLHLILGFIYIFCFSPLRRDREFLKAAKYFGLLAGAAGIVVNSYKTIDK